jgi:AcrR family transcriptional regulator
MSDKTENRNRAVLEAALELAQERGFAGITRDAVAERAGVAAGSVNNAYGDMNGLRDAVMANAVARELVDIVGAGLAAGHPAARNAPDDLKARALAKLAA